MASLCPAVCPMCEAFLAEQLPTSPPLPLSRGARLPIEGADASRSEKPVAPVGAGLIGPKSLSSMHRNTSRQARNDTPMQPRFISAFETRLPRKMRDIRHTRARHPKYHHAVPSHHERGGNSAATHAGVHLPSAVN